MAETVVGIYPSRAEAERASAQLEQAGISPHRVQVVSETTGVTSSRAAGALANLPPADVQRYTDALQRGQALLLAQTDGNEADRIRGILMSPPPVMPAATAAAPAVVRRISWAAVFAGVVIVLVTQLLLGLLGLGIGASTIDPVEERNPMAGLGQGAGVWFALSTLIALFAGGWAAGRLAGFPRKLDGTLHGVLTWGLATLLTVYLLTSAVGGLIGGTMRTLGSVAGAVGQGVAAVAPQAGEAIQAELDRRGIDWSDIRREARDLLRQTGRPELQPGAIATQAEQARQAARGAIADATQNPQAANQELDSALDRLFNRAQAVASAADREAVINVLVARTNMTRDEAARTVDRWEASYQQARARVEQAREQASQQARETAAAAADRVSGAALWSFVALALGLAAAAIGGRVGTPRDAYAGVGVR